MSWPRAACASPWRELLSARRASTLSDGSDFCAPCHWPRWPTVRECCGLKPPGPARTPRGRRREGLLDLRAHPHPPLYGVRTAASRQRRHPAGTGLRQLLHKPTPDVRHLRHRRTDLGEGRWRPAGHLPALLPASAQGMQCVRPHPRRKPHRPWPGRLPLRHLHSPASPRLRNLRAATAGQNLLATGARVLRLLPPTAGFPFALRRVLRHPDPGRDHRRRRVGAVRDLVCGVARGGLPVPDGPALSSVLGVLAGGGEVAEHRAAVRAVVTTARECHLFSRGSRWLRSRPGGRGRPRPQRLSAWSAGPG